MGKRVRGRKFRKIKSRFKNWGGGRITSCRELYTPLGEGAAREGEGAGEFAAS